jgi:hypothetical protein
MSGNDTDGHLHRHASIAAPASFPFIHEGYASFTTLMLGHDALWALAWCEGKYRLVESSLQLCEAASECGIAKPKVSTSKHFR